MGAEGRSAHPEQCWVANGRTALGAPGLDSRLSIRVPCFPTMESSQVQGRQTGGRYFGARRLLRSQPFTASDCMGSASSATVLRNSGLRRPPEPTPGRTRIALAGVLSGCVIRWNDRNTLTLSKAGTQLSQSPFRCLGNRRRSKSNTGFPSESVRYCSLEDNFDDLPKSWRLSR
jgi:hypothetical protein